MLYALNQEGQRVHATPKAIGTCPICEQVLVPKCGQIVVWHWAHHPRSDEDCDPWSEPETAWHLWWKSQIPREWCEVSVERHRADVLTPRKTVFEFQHSSIPAAAMHEREDFYRSHGLRLIWVIDAVDFEDNISFRPQSYGLSFRWKWPRKTLAGLKQPVFLDLPNRGEMFLIKKMNISYDYYGEMEPCGGWGRTISRAGRIRGVAEEVAW